MVGSCSRKVGWECGRKWAASGGGVIGVGWGDGRCEVEEWEKAAEAGGRQAGVGVTVGWEWEKEGLGPAVPG